MNELTARARVNWIILRTCIEERLVYRGDFAFATLIRFLPIVTQIFLWWAIYGGETTKSLNGYTYANMVAYYLLAMVGRAFSSMPGLASGIARDVRDGTVKKYLTQPIDMLGYLFWHRVAHKLVYYFVATGPFVLVFFLCRDYFTVAPDGLTILAFAMSLIMGFLIGFLIESLIGLISFWFLEVSSLIFIYMMINYFLSGHMIPLDWLPSPISEWVQLKRMTATEPGSSEPADPPPSVYNTTFWLAYVANLMLVTAAALTFRFAELVAYLGGTEQLAGTIVGVGMTVAILARFVVGQAIDHYGVRKLWLGGSALFVLSCSVFLLCRELSPLIYVARAGFAVSIACMFTCSIVHIQNQVPAVRRTAVIGNLGSSGFLGMIIGSQAGDAIFAAFPAGRAQFVALFSGTVVLGTLYLLLVAWLTRKDIHPRPKSTPPAHRLLRKYWPGNVVFVAIMMGVSLTVTTVFLTRFATHLGLKNGVGTFFTGYALFAFIFRLSTRNWSYSIGRHRMILLGLAGHGLGHALLPMVTTEWHFLIPAVICGFGHALLFPAVVSLGAGRFPQHYRGTGTTLVLGFVDLGSALSAPILGGVIDYFDHVGFAPMFYTSTITAFTIAVIYRLTAARLPDVDTDFEALQREVLEETGQAIDRLVLLGVLDNRFTYRGKPHRESVAVFDATFTDPTVYDREHIEILEDVWEGANPFRIRAYRGASRTIQGLTESLAEMARDEERSLTDLPGIGKDLAEKIETIVETGRLPQLDELREKVPEGVVAMLRLPGIGPKKVGTMFHELSIQSLDELKQAAENGQIAALKGFGKKTEQTILENIDQVSSADVRFRLAQAKAEADEIVDDLLKLKSVEQASVAGSCRRRKESVGDLDVLVTAAESAEAMDTLAAHPRVKDVLARGDTKQRVRLNSGIEMDLRVVPEESYGAAMQYFTGSKEHNIVIRRRAQERGLKLNEYGLFRDDELVAGRTEEEVYAAVDLPWIPPELREDRGEIEAAEGDELPELVEVSDIRGDLHMHTTATDGAATIREMAEAAKARGLKYIAITDHSKRVAMANGLDAKRLRAHWKAIDKVRGEVSGIDILCGIECDILEDATMDLPDDVLAEADWVIGVLHYGLKQPGAQINKRLLAAIENPNVSAIGHLTGRLIGKRPGADVSYDDVFKAAADHGVMMEINAHPSRLDLDDIHAAAARDRGIPIVINTDAHSTAGLDVMQYGVYQARRAGLTKKDIANTRTWKQFQKMLRHR
eukprot:g21453.t1